MANTNLHEFVETFRGRIDDDVIESAQGLDEHNESVIAFENFVSQLHEFDVSITRDEFAVIEALGRSKGLEPADWEFLKELIPG